MGTYGDTYMCAMRPVTKYYIVQLVVHDRTYVRAAKYSSIAASYNCCDETSEHLHDVAMLCDISVCVCAYNVGV